MQVFQQAALQPPRAHGDILSSGVIRKLPEDFVVDEIPSVEFTGEGEHVCLHIRKRQLNTEDVARKIAVLAGVKRRDVSYAGLKDKHAVTTQWFSVHLPGVADADWQQLESDQINVLEFVRNSRKLRRGTLIGNRFRILLRDLSVDRGLLESRLLQIKNQGVPNYFGPQRFGRSGSNLERGLEMFAGKRVKREQRGLYLSAARSLLFNAVLARRVASGQWDTALAGDVCMRSGSHGFFIVDEPDEDIQQRMASKQIHPSGPLWGKGELPAQVVAGQIELAVLEHYRQWQRGLEDAGLKMQRRALRVVPDELSWEIGESDLLLGFSLPAGCYATAVLREIIEAAPALTTHK